MKNNLDIRRATERRHDASQTSFEGKTMSRFGFAAALAVAILMAGAASAQQISIEDMRGKTIVLPKPAEKIVVIPIPLASVLMTLDGSSKRLIGINPSARQSLAEGFLSTIFPEALAIPTDIVRGGQFTPNLESILGSRPDLVVQWSAPPELTKSMEEAGLAVVGLTNDPPTQAINERNLAILAAIIGRGDRMRELLAFNRDAETRIAQALADVPTAAQPRVLYFRDYQAALRVAGTNSYRDWAFTLAKGINAAGELRGAVAVSHEQILRWNPDVILLGAFDEATPQMVIGQPELAAVEAVKNKRVYKMPHGGYRWDPGSHESLLAWQWLAALLHPDRVRIDMRAEMRKLYRFFYAHELTDTQIDAILRFDVNANMANYARFAGQ